jgi:glutamate/tyrosine decarboxylase-like PLP-dependent enzyme
LERCLQLGINEEVAHLQRNMGWLATTASATPFIGLFGTVWGVLDAFQGLGEAGGATLRAVAPGIAEALIATAFGLFAALAPERAHLLRGIERADSVAADAHKWLNVPYDCGFAFVRDAEALRGAFRSTAAYLAVEQPVWNPSSHVPESSRRFRALALWCALKAYGRAGIRAIVERGIANAAEFAAWAEAEEGLTLMSPATLNIVCFRLAPADMDEHAADDLNRRAVRALQADGRVFVSGTVWAGGAAIRAAFDNWMTGPEDVAILKQAVADVRDRLLARSDLPNALP